MNLVGHVAVAVHALPDAPTPFLVGCMLPDLAAMARVRLGPPSGELADGVWFHHASDAAFHSSRWFNDHNQTLRDRLITAGVERGAARACAHAGLEMLLDGHLVTDPAVARSATDAFGALGAEPTLDALRVLVEPDARDHWIERLRLIGDSLDPHSYASPDAVAHRLHRMTSGRTRIELHEAQVGIVARELASYQAHVGTNADDVLATVVREVR